MRRLIIYPDAEAEMIEAAAYYGRQQKNLSMRFLAAVQDAYTRVRINPTLYPLLDIEVRRCLIRVFPYAVIFRVVDAAIVVVAVMHLSRDPDYWKHRH